MCIRDRGCRVPILCFFSKCSPLLFRPRSFLALSAAAHAEGPRVHYGASLAPGRAPWRVLWTFKAAQAGSFHWIAFRRARAKQAHENPHLSFFIFSPLFRSAAVQQPSKATQPRYNSTRASSFSLCDNHVRCFCVRVCARVCVCARGCHRIA